MSGIFFSRGTPSHPPPLSDISADSFCFFSQRILAQFVEELVLRFEDAHGANEPKACVNAALLISALYNFGAIHCDLVYDLIRRLCNEMGEIKLEVLVRQVEHKFEHTSRAHQPSTHQPSTHQPSTHKSRTHTSLAHTRLAHTSLTHTSLTHTSLTQVSDLPIC